LKKFFYLLSIFCFLSPVNASISSKKELERFKLINYPKDLGVKECINDELKSDDLLNTINNSLVTMKFHKQYLFDGDSENKFEVFGVVIGQSQNETYIVSPINSPGSYPTASGLNREVTWNDGSKDHAAVIYFMNDQFGQSINHKFAFNNLGLFKVKAKKGIPLQINPDKNYKRTKTFFIDKSSKQEYLKNSKIEMSADFGKRYILDKSSINKFEDLYGSPQVDDKGCLVGINDSTYPSLIEAKNIISNMQIWRMLKEYISFRKLINEKISDYSLESDEEKWPISWSNILKNKSPSQEDKDLSVVYLNNSLIDSCKKAKDLSIEIKNNPEINIEDDIYKKLFAMDLNILRLAGHDDWEMFSRIHYLGIGDILSKDANNSLYIDSKKGKERKITKFYLSSAKFKSTREDICSRSI